SVQRVEPSELVRQQRVQRHDQHRPESDQHRNLRESSLEGQRQLRTGRAQLATLAAHGVLDDSNRKKKIERDGARPRLRAISAFKLGVNTTPRDFHSSVEYPQRKEPVACNTRARSDVS